MDLQSIDARLQAYDQRAVERIRAINKLVDETARKINSYTEADLERAITQTNYDLRSSIRPLLNEVLAAYVDIVAAEREAIREIFGKYFFATSALFEYIFECIECLETPADENIFRLAMIAASIQNYAQDFRDVDGVLAELAIAAYQAGINIEPHCTTIAALSSNINPLGFPMNMQARLSTFHLYAPNAVRIFE